ncbi:MAG: phenylalanine--tRNA ligase subunit beta [Candidatus Aenigmatarchaeota archaeon]
MPTIEASYQDLCELIGRRIEIEELKELVNFAKCEIEEVEGDSLKIEAKDTNRPDLWSSEGIAREIRSRAFKPSFPEYEVKSSEVVVRVDKKVSKVRPYTVCAVVKNLKVTPAFLSQMIQLQEKIAGSLGRNRKEVAIGVYDFDKIKPPIKFTTVKPDGIKFIPLDFNEALTPREILEKHPKGKEFGHLLAGKKEYPIFIDARNEVLSLPPIINSEYSGKVTEETKNVFIECSGFNLKFLMPALNVMVTAMADRGGEICSVKVVYPDKTIVTPDLKPKKTFVDVSYVRKISGLDLSLDEICKLLEKANYKILKKGKKIELLYPAYRNDIMHQRDVVEDVIISYGYNKIRPEPLKMKVEGKVSEIELKTEKVEEMMVSLGFQEILSYTLTSKDNLFRKMNLKEEKVAEIENIISENWCVFRNWLLPSLMEFFANNQHVEYPQKIFEVGDVVLIDKKQETRTRDVRKLAVAIADSKVSYDDIVAVLDAFMSLVGAKYKLKASKHPSFIEGRTAEILVKGKAIGIIGEIHPSVLENWKLEMPIAAFEIDLSFIL